MPKTKSKKVSNLPNEIIQQIAQLSTPAMTQLAGSCKTFHSAFQPELDKRAAKQLLAYVLNPTPENIVKAKAMYAANPRILFIKTEGYEPASGVDESFARAVPRKFIGSPFQAALGTGDSALYKDMATYFDKIVYKNESGAVIETGIQRALKQLQEKFPNGFDYPPGDYDFTELVAAFTNDQMLIETGNPSKATKAILAKFRKDFLPNEITQGHHFDLHHLIKAVKIYNQQYRLWNLNQKSLFWRQVIGYLERLVPVVDAQAFCQGLEHVLGGKQAQTRGLSLFNHQSSSNILYYPLNLAGVLGSDWELGFDFGIEINLYGAAGHACGGRGAPCEHVEKLCRTKISELDNFKQLLEQRAQQPSFDQNQEEVHNCVKRRKFE